jgi:hypothetical protein
MFGVKGMKKILTSQKLRPIPRPALADCTNKSHKVQYLADTLTNEASTTMIL